MTLTLSRKSYKYLALALRGLYLGALRLKEAIWKNTEAKA